MKKIMLLCLLAVSSFSLVACVTSGGGGGSPLTPKSTFSVNEVMVGMDKMDALAADYSNSGDSGGLERTLKGPGLEGTPGDAGKNISVTHGASIDVSMGAIVTEFKVGGAEDDAYLWGSGGMTYMAGLGKDVDDAALEILRATRGIDEPGTYPDALHPKGLQVDTDEYFIGTISYGKQVLQLNAGLVDLEYSSFGAWGLEMLGGGEFRDGAGNLIADYSDQYREIVYPPLSGGDDSMFKDPAVGSFTGGAIAMGLDYNGGPQNDLIQKFFTGTASLDVTSATTGTIRSGSNPILNTLPRRTIRPRLLPSARNGCRLTLPPTPHG